MFRFFTSTHKLVKEDTPDRLVLCTSPRRSVIFDVAQQRVVFESSHLLFRKKTKTVAFEEIEQVYLDYVETTYSDATDVYGTQERIKRKWTIFLALKDRQTITVAADVTTNHLPGETSSLAKQSVYWESLVTKICELTGTTLVRTPSVPGDLHTFVESVHQILQRHLAQSQLHDRCVYLRSGEDGRLEIVVDSTVYDDLDQVEDKAVRDLIQAAVDEWQGNDESSFIAAK